jgi:hypothetical protein
MLKFIFPKIKARKKTDDDEHEVDRGKNVIRHFKEVRHQNKWALPVPLLTTHETE